MAKRGRPEQRSEWARRIRPFIPTNGYIPGRVLMKLAGLKSLGQVRSAVAWIRDHHPDQGLVSTLDGYRFTVDTGPVKDYTKARVRTAQTQLTRTFAGVYEQWLADQEAAGADPLLLRLAREQYERTLREIGVLSDVVTK